MSVKKNKLDLLFKVRYQNALPPPPFPPKLLNIPTHPSRYAGPEFTAALASEMPLPMVVDAELGMPLDLSFWDCLWNEDGSDPISNILNPEPEHIPPVDPRDAFMLVDAPSLTNGSGPATPVTPQVSWLRRTEYISGVTSNRTQNSARESRRANNEPIDISTEAQIRDIEASFEFANDKFDLSKIKHPAKSHVTAVESYEILPDVEIWANAYDLFRFQERPGERPLDVPDPRLDCAILRPMESDGDHFLAYYLAKEDEIAENFKEKRRQDEEVEETIFSFVRDYETVKIEQEVPNEFLLVLDDGEEDDSPFGDTPNRRGKGAYYKNLERKIMLKKRRVNQWDTYADKWDAINLTLAPFSQDEQEERDEILAEVTDPSYIYSRADADADGEVDDTVVNMNGHAEDPHDLSGEALGMAEVEVNGQ